ncbi:hypothetical protein CRENBAI_022533 [Crenichthys baileyi]|uniref:Uncharacterized protein n=1 Tax=Crenichthys baileyi TaxID=28760 RepID=A0AAV9SB83_9TELE
MRSSCGWRKWTKLQTGTKEQGSSATQTLTDAPTTEPRQYLTKPNLQEIQSPNVFLIMETDKAVTLLPVLSETALH